MINIVGAELDEKYLCHTSSPTFKVIACTLPHISSYDEYYEVERNYLDISEKTRSFLLVLYSFSPKS